MSFPKTVSLGVAGADIVAEDLVASGNGPAVDGDTLPAWRTRCCRLGDLMHGLTQRTCSKLIHDMAIKKNPTGVGLLGKAYQ